MFKHPLWSEGCGLSLSRVGTSRSDESSDEPVDYSRGHKRVFWFPYAVSNHYDNHADHHSVVRPSLASPFPLFSDEGKAALSCLYSPVEVTYLVADSEPPEIVDL